MKKRYLIPTIVFLLFLCSIALLNKKVTMLQGVDGKVLKITLPLYLKVLNFYDRHLNYKWLARQITGHLDTGEDKILRLFHWTHETIKPQPESLPVMDGHPWDVYVRGYGDSANFHDLFSTLCNYIGVDAFFTRFYARDTSSINLSIVRIKRGWVVFDPYNGIYFRNNTGDLATIEEINEQNWHIVKLSQTDISKANYEQYIVENLPRIKRLGSSLIRANIQSPINRLKFQLHIWLSGKRPLLE
jgi:hypothetical protein